METVADEFIDSVDALNSELKKLTLMHLHHSALALDLIDKQINRQDALLQLMPLQIAINDILLECTKKMSCIRADARKF